MFSAMSKKKKEKKKKKKKNTNKKVSYKIGQLLKIKLSARSHVLRTTVYQNVKETEMKRMDVYQMKLLVLK